MGYTTGQKITIKNAPYYVASDSAKSLGTKSGTFYIWSGATKNGRIRITSKKSYAGRNPASKYVTCWIKTSSIGGSSGSSGATKTTTTTANKTTTVTKKTATTVKKPTTSATSASSKANTQIITNIVEASNVTPTTTKAGQIGFLGMVLFLVSDSTFQTLKDFEWELSASYQEHERHMKAPTLEFTGINSQKITFTLYLSSYLGAPPMTAFNTLKSYMESGTAIPFKLGKQLYGRYRWCVNKLSFSGENTDKAGNWTAATVRVSIISVEKKG